MKTFSTRILPTNARWLLVGIALLSTAISVARAAPDGPVTSELDDRVYRHLVLDNGMQVMLASDPQADQAAASLDVAIGSGSDPKGREGLAHFLEHMLFLGTKKYPSAGEYQEYIKNHGGGNNAYTSYDHTNFFFSVRPEFLEGALDRFSQFFVAPLFNEDLVKRERVIVDSEYSARSDEEGRRTFAAQRQAYNPDHPRSRFSVGSLETLADREGDPVRKDLIAFYDEHYSAHLMTLAVIGREDLDVLETWVRDRFSAVQRTGAKRFVSDEPVFREGQLPEVMNIVPLKERREVSFSFEVPSTLALYREKPLYQISNILGHEGEGSLLAALKQRGWATGLSAGPNSMDSRRGLMDVEIDLTPAGAAQVPAIGEMLFAAIRNIKEQGIARWRFDEEKTLSDISFRYRDKIDPVSLVQGISDRLHDYPWREVFVAPYLFEDFDPSLVDEYLGYLTPDRAMVTVIGPGLETDSREKWFGTAYQIRSLDPELAARWSDPGHFAELSLPEPNPFVPEHFAMVEDAAVGGVPVKVEDKPGITVWHRTDTSFGAPRAEFYFSFRSPRAKDSPADADMVDLFTRIVEDRLNTFSYPADLAGLDYDVYSHLRGFSVRVSGFSDRQDTLLERVAGALRSTAFDPGRYERVRADLAESYRNRLLASPSRLAMSELQQLLLEDAWSLDARISALDNIGFDDFTAFARDLFKRGNLVVLSVGNRLPGEARAMAGILEQTLLAGVEPTEVPRSAVVRLDPSKHYDRVIHSEHKDSVVGLYKQGDADSYRERALFYLYDQLSESSFFDQLRTQKKLGYIVQSFAMPIMNVPGMMFLVQSPTTNAGETEAAIREFIDGFGKTLELLEPAALDQARDALLSQVNQRDDALSDRAQRYWRELDDEEYHFDSREQLSAALEAITIDDMHEFARRISAPSMSSLVIRSDGAFEAPADGGTPQRMSRSEIVDYASFKEGHAVF